MVIRESEGTPTAKRLVMRLLQAESGNSLRSSQLVTACRVFDISENNTRVALARLSAAGLVETAERGLYKLGERATPLAAEIAMWRDFEQRTVGWEGAFVIAECGPRSALKVKARRGHERALKIQGMQSLKDNTYVRPDNITGGVAAARERLRRLGLEPGATVFKASDFDAATMARIRALWNTAALNRSYSVQRTRLEGWLDAAAALSPEAAAKQCFLLGNESIRRVIFDPLLPEDWVDVGARRAYFATVRHFDAIGQQLWQRVYQIDDPDFEAHEPTSRPLLKTVQYPGSESA